MKSLSIISALTKRVSLALVITSVLAVSAFAQRVDPRNEGLRYGDAGFRGEPINLSVVNADIRDILSYITEQYGINFVIDKSVKEVPVTVKLNEVPWNVALDSVLQSQSLSAQVNGNILRVVDSSQLTKEIELQKIITDGAIDGTPLYTEFLRLNYARASGTLSGDSGGSGQLTTGTSAQSGGGSSAGGSGGGSDPGILGIVKKRLSRRGTVEVDGRSNTLIITDVKHNIDAIRQLVAYLDQPEPQVEIEARIVVASRNFSRDIGVQLGALLTGPRGSGAGGGTFAPIPVDPRLNVPPSLPEGTINNALGALGNSILSLTTGVLGTAQLSAMITAGEQAKVIATPRVTALNNRPAEIKSGVKIPVTTVQPGGGAGGGGGVIATTTYVDVPLRLAITPQITDLGTVILNVVAENSSTAAIVGSVAPAINTQSMTTQVTVPDGGTTVIGGVLFDDETAKTVPQVFRVFLF
ncbi:MAG TPA: hypothetical protein PKA82_07145 [Pyrinomonadaceae bacterium]|nr:hypothetical protein [Pyrinomonadaceae bacterium]